MESDDRRLRVPLWLLPLYVPLDLWLMWNERLLMVGQELLSWAEVCNEYQRKALEDRGETLMGRRTVIVCECRGCGWIGEVHELTASGWCPKCLSPNVKRESKDVWSSGM